jgi:hypothetical protein
MLTQLLASCIPTRVSDSHGSSSAADSGFRILLISFHIHKQHPRSTTSIDSLEEPHVASDYRAANTSIKMNDESNYSLQRMLDYTTNRSKLVATPEAAHSMRIICRKDSDLGNTESWEEDLTIVSTSFGRTSVKSSGGDSIVRCMEDIMCSSSFFLIKVWVYRLVLETVFVLYCNPAFIEGKHDNYS